MRIRVKDIRGKKTFYSIEEYSRMPAKTYHVERPDLPESRRNGK